MTAHRNDLIGAHLLSGEHTEQADGAVTDNHNRRARLHPRGIGREPAGSHDIGERQKTRDQILRRHIGSDDQGAVCEWHPQHTRLRCADKLSALTRRLVSVLTVGTIIVRREE